MSKIKNGGLDQYGDEPFERHQFVTAGVEGVNSLSCARKVVVEHSQMTRKSSFIYNENRTKSTQKYYATHKDSRIKSTSSLLKPGISSCTRLLPRTI